MSYIKAEEVLPEEIIRIIQTYVDGKNIYIPRKNDERDVWGNNTGIRQELSDRNTKIYMSFQNGRGTKQIAEDFCLSQKSIQRIIRHMN